MNKSLLLLSVIAVTAVAPAQSRIYRPRRTIKVYVMNRPVRFDRATPLMSGRNVLVPLRGVFEMMGAAVHYNPRTKRITAQRGNTHVLLRPNRRMAEVNGELRRLDAYPTIYRGRMLVPLRFLAETLDSSVIYTPTDASVRIVPH